MAADIGRNMEVVAYTDTSVAKHIALSPGAGNIRHNEVYQLWVQDKVANKDITIHIIGSDDNPADLLKKHLNPDTMNIHLRFLDYNCVNGHHGIALFSLRPNTTIFVV